MGGQFSPKHGSNLSLLKVIPEEETQPDAVTSQQEQQKAERGEKTAENVRYGQAISEQGVGGKTTEAEGSANQGKMEYMRCSVMMAEMLKHVSRRIWSNRCTGRYR